MFYKLAELEIVAETMKHEVLYRHLSVELGIALVPR